MPASPCDPSSKMSMLSGAQSHDAENLQEDPDGTLGSRGAVSQPEETAARLGASGQGTFARF